MAEKKGSGFNPLSPLWSTGVGHARMHSPKPTEFPDPLGYMPGKAPLAPWVDKGSGDDVNDWDAEREQP